VLPPHSAFHTLYLPEGARAINIILRSRLFEALSEELAEIKDSSALAENSGFSIFHCEKEPRITQYAEELMKIYIDEKTKLEKTAPPQKSELIYAEKLAETLLSALQIGLESKKITAEYSESATASASPDEIIYYIKNNYATVSTAELSRRFGYSERQLYRMIRRVTGNTFQLLVMLERINHAKELLIDSSLSVDEISGVVGLKSRSYFCNMFKKQTNMTPLQYRKARLKL
jgi:AraC-like DNA-binding protein